MRSTRVARLSASVPAKTAAVCVPVRNEAALLPRFLDALAAQRDADRFTLCVLFDGCKDDSAAIVAARATTLPFAVVTADALAGDPNAGLARRRAMALGLSVLSADDSMIVSTDADSVPDPDWLVANRAALEVADVAAGRIVRSGGAPNTVQDRVEAYYDGLFALRRTIDPVPWEAARTHHYTSGASLAFRKGVYRDLGGFEPLPSAEDARLVDAAHRAGLRVRRDAAIRVETSARRVGRATGGLADHLRQLDSGIAAATMAHPDDMVWRYRQHAAARLAWPDPDACEALAVEVGRDPCEIVRVAATAINAEAFAMQIVIETPGGERIISLEEAELALSALRNDRRLAA